MKYGVYNNVSAKDRVQALNYYQTKLKVGGTYSKDEKPTKTLNLLMTQMFQTKPIYTQKNPK